MPGCFQSFQSIAESIPWLHWDGFSMCIFLPSRFQRVRTNTRQICWLAMTAFCTVSQIGKFWADREMFVWWLWLINGTWIMENPPGFQLLSRSPLLDLPVNLLHLYINLPTHWSIFTSGPSLYLDYTKFHLVFFLLRGCERDTCVQAKRDPLLNSQWTMQIWEVYCPHA